MALAGRDHPASLRAAGLASSYPLSAATDTHRISRSIRQNSGRPASRKKIRRRRSDLASPGSRRSDETGHTDPTALAADSTAADNKPSGTTQPMSMSL